jgi:hypothetical protein
MRQQSPAKTKVSIAILFGVYMVDGRFILDTNDKKYLEGYDASLIREDKKGTLKIIKQSLGENIPLHVLHLTENLLGNKEPVLHYAVLIGYDEEKEEFTLADTYGFNKTIGKDDFFEAISFRNDCLPEFVKKVMPSNAMIRFSKRT